MYYIYRLLFILILGLAFSFILAFILRPFNILYYTDGSGLYSVTKDSKPSKVSNKSSDEVYILDENWIYLYNKNGKIYRVSFDGGTCERVKL